ncbi:hypothetical protein PIB30_083972 [Stylosanthes scabra]|uniref:Uncharacterized protein n=1 Tax=Stylosanthes scabra TaxID=79078 RepID=A0ABU6TRW9_9FABA|nr:hypothetical protein [Stylosanthes scabra]
MWILRRGLNRVLGEGGVIQGLDVICGSGGVGITADMMELMWVGGGWGTLKRVRVLLHSVLSTPRREVWRLGMAAANCGWWGFGCGKGWFVLGGLGGGGVWGWVGREAGCGQVGLQAPRHWGEIFGIVGVSHQHFKTLLGKSRRDTGSVGVLLWRLGVGWHA